MKYRLLFIGAIIWIIAWTYITIVNISTQYQMDGNDAALNGILFNLKGDKEKSDSCREVAKHLYGRSENTIRLIPKFIQP